MADATEASSAPLRVDTARADATQRDALHAAHDAVSPSAEGVRKAANEWASPRGLGRRGTPPPAPRRASRTEEELAASEQPPRPRTPAQVLASRAQAAKAASVAQAPTGGAVEKSDTEASEPERTIDGETMALDRMASGVVDVEEADSRRESIRSLASDSELRREERVDTSTVDEESMYNDDDEGDDDDRDHDSIGTSDEYVNIHEDEEENGDEDDGDEYQQQQYQADESLTPDCTPPPTPLLAAQPPPPVTSEWIRYVTESGHEYYFNTRTQVSQWTRPEQLLSPRGIVATINEEGVAEEGEDVGDENQNDAVSNPPPQRTVAPFPMYVPVARPSFATTSFVDSLFVAVSRNDEAAQLQTLLRYGIDVNAVNALGLTPLHVAVQHGNARGAAMLLDYGALVDGPSDPSAAGLAGSFAPVGLIETPLVMACRTNHASLVRLLVRYGASIYTRDGDGNTVLHIAIRCWSDEALSCLLEMDAMTSIINLKNADDETPLHLAARHGNANSVKELLQRGASSDIEDGQGRTPLVVSIMENRVDCVELLQNIHFKSRQGYDTGKHESGPVMYDSDPMQQEQGKHIREELDSLRIYLTHLLQSTATDGVVLSTIYQYIEVVQRELAMTAVAEQENQRREENLLTQIDELTANESTTTNELAKEKEENERLRHQLEMKEAELSSLHAAYESISSRSSMLESIARSSQDKLRRERAEFARQEEYWNQTIENSLRENALLLDSVQSLQQGWHGQAADLTPKTNELRHGTHDSVSNSEHQQSYDISQAQEQHTAYYGAYSTEYLDKTRRPDQFTQNDDATQSMKVVSTSASTSSPKSEPERPVSPERVDAVWNRFFQNMSRVAEGNVMSPSQGSATLSTHQTMTPLLPPASAVFEAIRRDNKDRLQQLLLSGISPNVRDIGEKGTPLHLASEVGDLDAVMMLCEYGADVEIRDENGNTPLLLACSHGHYECTKFLLQSAANHSAVNSTRDTALHLAAWDGSFECVEILLEYGVDVLAHNSLGLTALANLKTRSPLHHRFDDLAPDHSMARTLLILEEAEREESNKQATTAYSGQKLLQSNPLPIQPSFSKEGPKDDSARNVSWGRWILGSVFGSARASSQNDKDDVSDDEDSKSDFEEAHSSPPKLESSLLHDYEDLRPPPEIAAELRRKPLSPSSDPLPPPPPEVLEALERRKSGVVLSPSHSATRFASPASVSATKRPQLATPTSVRSRYVDTFNHP